MSNHLDKSPQTGRGLGKLLVLPLSLASGWIAYSFFGVNHRMPLVDAIPAERRPFLSKSAGWLSYYADTSAAGRPLVLVHSVNAAASAFEMLPLFQHYRGRRPVFALDLPGYGFSNRLSRDYTPQLFANAIAEFVEGEAGGGVDAVALSLGCEFVARAAGDRPDLFHSLAFISPSGLSEDKAGRATQRSSMSGVADAVHALLAFPLWARPLFDLVSSRRSIEFFLRQSFVGPVYPGMVDYAYLTSHQPGAEHAPLHFLSGRLFTRNAGSVLYDQVQAPTLVIYDQDAYVRFDGLPALLARNPQFQAMRLAPSKGLPQFERIEDVTAALDRFWSEQG